MKDTASLNGIMKKYGFLEEVPEHVQILVTASKQKNLVSTLKKVHQYTPLFGITASFYLWLTGKGLKMSLLSVKLLVAAIALTIAGTVTAVTAVSIYSAADPASMNTETVTRNTRTETIKEENESISTKQVKNEYMMGFNTLKVNNTHRETGSALTMEIYSNLKKLLGDDYITLIQADKTVSGRYILTGSVSLLEKENIIAIRVFDTQSGQIVLSDIYNCPSVYPDKECSRKIAFSLADKIKSNIKNRR